MTRVTRKEIFAQAAKKLRNDFDELSSTILHSGVKGGEAEDLVRKFLQGHLPKRFDAGSGFIIDPHDGMSKQTDVIDTGFRSSSTSFQAITEISCGTRSPASSIAFNVPSAIT